MIKRLTALLVLLALVFCAAASAPAETALTAEIQKASDYAHIGLIADDAIYIMGSNNLYIWRDGDREMTAYTGDDLPGTPIEAFTRNGDLWLVIYSPYQEQSGDITLARVKTEQDGRYTVPETLRFSAPVGSLLPGESPDMTSAVCVGDTLYMLLKVDYGDAQLWAYKWGSGKSSAVRTERLGRRLFAAPGEQLLVECMDCDAGSAWFEMYDPKTGAFTPHGGVFEYDKMNGGLLGAAWDSLNDLLYYQKDGVLKCAANMAPENEETVTTITHPTDSMSLYAGITAKKDYAFLTREGPIVIDLDDSLNRVTTFTVVMRETQDAVVKTLQEMQKWHPDLATAIDAKEYTDQELSGQIVSYRDDADVYILETDNIFPMMLFFRNYLPAITAPEVKDAVSKMYPAIRSNIETNGRLIAVPVSVEGDTIGFNRDVLEALAGKGTELPTSFTELAEKLTELNGKCGDHEEYSIFPLHMSQDAIRVYLMFYILSVYGKAMEDEPTIGFNTPELNGALNALMDIDLDEMGIDDDTRTRENVYNVKPLISGGASTVCGQYNRECEPLPLTVFPGQTPIMPIDMKVAIINPHSPNKELAQEFMAELLKHLDDTTLYTVRSDMNTPIPDTQIQERLEDIAEQQAQMEGNLKDANGIENEEADFVKDGMDTMINNLKERMWKLSPESIERFRANADKMYITTYNYSVTGDAAKLLRSLLDRRITVEEFTKELDKRTKMVIKEGF